MAIVDYRYATIGEMETITIIRTHIVQLSLLVPRREDTSATHNLHNIGVMMIIKAIIAAGGATPLHDEQDADYQNVELIDSLDVGGGGADLGARVFVIEFVHVLVIDVTALGGEIIESSQTRRQYQLQRACRH